MPPKKSEDVRQLSQLKQDLSQHTLGSLYVFYGEETYLRDYYLDEMKKQLVGDWGAFCFHCFSGKNLSPQALADAVDTFPMGSERTMVVVYDYDLYQANGKEEWMALLADVPAYCCLIFVYDIQPYKADARTKLYGLLKSKGQTVQFAQQSQSDLVRWIARRFAATGHEIGQREAEYLIFLCGGLMTGLISEIGKISAYATSARITKEEIDAVADPVLDAVVFQMTDAVLKGNIEQATKILGDLLRMQQPPIMILSVLGKQMRQLHAARLAMEHGKDASDLTRLWGMRSAYPAQNLMRSARNFDLIWCRNAVKLCAKTDFMMKQSGIKPEEQLVMLLLQLLDEAKRKGR